MIIARRAVVAAASCLFAFCSFHHATAAQDLGRDAAFEPVSFEEQPGRLEFTGRMIVSPKRAAQLQAEGVPALAARQAERDARAVLSATLVQYEPEVDHYIVEVPEGLNETSFANQLLATGHYRFAHPDWMCYPAETPNDPQYSLQWFHPVIQSELAWDITTGSEDIIIAFVDQGIDEDHPDLEELLLPGYNSAQRLRREDGGEMSDTCGHGTNVAGCIAAIGNNGEGIVGAAWRVTLMPIRCASGCGASLGSILHGARWAVENGARAASCSWTGVGNAAVEDSGRYIWELGGVLLYAADNFNDNHSDFDWEHVMVVGATNQNDQKAGFSSYGRGVDIFAPGVDIRTTFRGGAYGNNSGTSFATPMTAGLLGLVWSLDPAFNNEQAQEWLYQNADDLGEPGEDDFFGFGRINSFRTVQEAQQFVGTNYPPIAGPDFALLFTGSDRLLDVLANDYERNIDEGFALVDWDETSAGGGTIEFVEGGGADGRDALRYTAGDGFTGFDTFTYTIRDDRDAEAVGEVTVEVVDPGSFRDPDVLAARRPGARALYYEAIRLTELPDFDQLMPYAGEVWSQINVEQTVGEFAGSGRADEVGAVVEGYIVVDEPDRYTFTLRSSDGSRLTIGDTVVIDHDGLRNMDPPGTGVIELKPGAHRFRVDFFERVGFAGLILELNASSGAAVPLDDGRYLVGGATLADWNADGVVNNADVGRYLTAYFRDQLNGTDEADVDGIDGTDAGDVGAFLTEYFAAL